MITQLRSEPSYLYFVFARAMFDVLMSADACEAFESLALNTAESTK